MIQFNYHHHLCMQRTIADTTSLDICFTVSAPILHLELHRPPALPLRPIMLTHGVRSQQLHGVGSAHTRRLHSIWHAWSFCMHPCPNSVSGRCTMNRYSHCIKLHGVAVFPPLNVSLPSTISACCLYLPFSAATIPIRR
jgi:hypothetical protein